jgi:hypothetical protein
MMPKRNKYEEQLARIMGALANSVQRATDDELIDEARCEHQDQLKSAEQVRAVLQRALRDVSQSKLRAAREQYTAISKRLHENDYELPSTASERRRLLLSVLHQRRDIGAVVITAQYRDFSELSDEDVEGFLRQLKELGLLPAQVQPLEE